MKKILLLLLVFTAFAPVKAQGEEPDGLQIFINELKALGPELVEYESTGVGELFENMECELDDNSVEFDEVPFTAETCESYISFGAITSHNPEHQLLQISSVSDEGYNAMAGIIERYDIAVADEFFGIPLMANNIEDGEQQVVFVDEENTLLVYDSGDEVTILYANFNIMEVLYMQLSSILDISGDAIADVEFFGDVDFSFSLLGDGSSLANNEDAPPVGATVDDILSLARSYYAERLSLLENAIANAQAEDSERLAEEIEEFRECMEEELDELSEELQELDGPSFVEIGDGSDMYMVAIPVLPEESREGARDYAVNGIYDWINSTGFAKGASMQNIDQISCIVTPRDVAMQYAIRNLPRGMWYDDGFLPQYKSMAVKEYQGGTPAILYRFSQNAAGYNSMLEDLGFLFDLELGETFRNMEVTQQSKHNGNRFVRLWGDGDVSLCVLDNGAEGYCHFSVIVGGSDGFREAVNNYSFGGETNFAEKCNIIIDSDLSNNSYGIHFTADEYFFAGYSHKNGVHINFRYWEMYTK